MKNVRFASFATGLMLCVLAQGALAQYVWVDEKGVKQFSDMPPPVNVPKSRILKQPAGTRAAAASADEPASTAAAVSSRPKGPMTTAEQNADFRKRQLEKAEKDKKAAEAAKRDAVNAANCERTRAYQRTLESGERIAHTDANGERVFLSDEQREREIQEARRNLAECK